jgi:hypothetical protein
MLPARLLALLLVPLLAAQEPKPKDAGPAKKPVDPLKQADEVHAKMTPVEEVAFGLSVFYPRFYGAAVKGEGGRMELVGREGLVARAELCLKSDAPANATATTKADHARFKQHPEAVRKLLGAIQTVDGAPVKYLVPQMKPHELPFWVGHALRDDKSPLVGVLTCIYVAREADASKTKPDERVRDVARTIALPASAELAAGAHELGLDQVGVLVLQPCRDPSAGEQDAVKAELVLCVFPVAELAAFKRKELDEKAMLGKALAFEMTREDEKMTRTDALKP